VSHWTEDRIYEALGALMGIRRSIDAGSPPEVLKRFVGEAERILERSRCPDCDPGSVSCGNGHSCDDEGVFCCNDHEDG
jgi:hypothetical protein